MSDLWRLACPEGHRTVTRRQESRGGMRKAKTHHWRCETCGENYETVTDLKRNTEIAP